MGLRPSRWLSLRGRVGLGEALQCDQEGLQEGAGSPGAQIGVLGLLSMASSPTAGLGLADDGDHTVATPNLV